MNEFQNFVHKKKILVYPQGCLSEREYFLPFALTDVLTTFAGIHRQPIIYFWQLEQAMILGMKDTRVTNLKNGLAVLKLAGYSAVIRNSGGLGVIADKGILNVSLILPNPKEKKLGIDDAYTLMWSWLQAAFATKSGPIDAFEISDSYCPGTFDLSIHGKKFAGIAQRRVKDGVAVMIYLSVNGDQQKRGETVRKFYLESLGENFGKHGYPPVNPAVMGTLEELLHQPLSIKQVQAQLLSVLSSEQLDNVSLFKTLQTEGFQSDLNQQIEKMKDRNLLIKCKEGIDVNPL